MRLKELLQEADMTQRELADKTGLTEATISRYVNGSREPRGKALARIATVLGVTTDYLLGASQARQETEEITSEEDYYLACKAIIRSGTKWEKQRLKTLIETLVTIL